jgi:hypothetical protein
VSPSKLFYPPSNYLLSSPSYSIPPFHDVANAVGAAIASVSGEVDTIEILEGRKLDDVLGIIKQRAIQNAVDAGADASTTRVVEVTVLPVQVFAISPC